MRWFRFYDDTVNDPKVQRLSGEMFKAWVNLLCIASKHDGVLPSISDIAFTLRIPEDKAETRIKFFIENGLLDDGETGMSPHNWNGRQYKSDDSSERVKRHRQRKRNVTVTASETPPDTETDTETESSRGNEKKTRIPDGWKPSQKISERAFKELALSFQDIRDEGESFHEYFWTKTGAKALHRNWDITFWNWLKRSKKFGQDRKQSTGRPKSMAETFANLYAKGEELERQAGNGGNVVELVPRLLESS
jgi:hypothetical protein